MGKLIRLVGPEEVETIILDNHALAMEKSQTRRAELNSQLKNPNAGVLAHLKACPGCAATVRRAAAEILKVASLKDSRTPFMVTA